MSENSENDADIFFDKESPSPPEEDSATKHELLSAFKHNFLISKPNPTSPDKNWYEFKANDGVSAMISRKFLEKEQEIIKEQLLNSGKPANMIEKIMLGKIF